MATKQDKVNPQDPQNEGDKVLNEDAPASAYPGDQSSPDVREGKVGEKVSTSFDERTGVTQPFVLANGVQDNGLRNPEKAEGARRSATRDNENTTTVEETDKAIKEGIVEGKQTPIDDVAEEKPKNPVK